MADAGSRLACFATGLLLLFSLLARCASAQAGIGVEVNSTRSYVDTVNESAYLIFYPNLTAAYNYVDSAANVSHTNPAYAQVLLGKARESAEAQLAGIDRYKAWSFYALVATSVVLAVLLERLMRAKLPKKARK
jgi:hypothetical protein